MKQTLLTFFKGTAALALLGVITFQFSCQSDNGGEEIIPLPDDPLPSEITPLPDADPIVLRSEYDAKVEQDNLFAFDLLKTTIKNDDKPNVFVSPLSVSMALSMTLNGAEGETFDEMRNALRINNYSLEGINDYNKTMRAALLEIDPSTQINIANSIWNKQGFPVKPLFLQSNQNFYSAEVSEKDFTDPNTLKVINQWCSDQTNGKIEKILDEISPYSVMYLINAVYFKGIWTSKFEKDQTKDLPFYAENGGKETVPMMRQTETFNYSTDENGAYAELPYGNKAFSMVIMLPNEGKTTQDVLDNVDFGNLRFSPAKMNLELPRFKVECKYELQKKILPEMGMKKAFTPNAEFGNLSPEPEVFISKVIHKTYVDVSEEGTEAAAVTAVVVDVTAVFPDPHPVDFIVNKPFLFLIRENSTGVILFAGKIGSI